MFETNPVAGGPNPQLLVDAFPGHADHLADLLLGDGDRSAARRVLVFFGQPNKRAGEPAGQVLKDDLFDLVTGPPQLRAKQLDEFHRERRMASYKRKKFAAIDHKDLAIRNCRGVGCPRLPIEHRDLSDDLAGADQIKNRAAAVGRGDADLHGAADHGDEAVAGISLGDDRGSPLQRGVLGVTAQLFEGLIIKIAKDRMLAQDRKFAARKPASFSCVVLRHGHDHLITSLSIIDGSRPNAGSDESHQSAALSELYAPMVQQERPELASSSFTRLLVKGENNWITILDYHTGDAWQIDGADADYQRQTEICGTDACSLSTGRR